MNLENVSVIFSRDFRTCKDTLSISNDRFESEPNLNCLQSLTTSGRRMDKISPFNETKIWTVRGACSIVMLIYNTKEFMDRLFVTNAAVVLERR